MPESWLEELRLRVDMGDLAARYGVQWDTRGAQPRACCPFHQEQTPSLYLYDGPRVGPPRVTCYGACGRSWDAIGFLVDGQGRGFREAVEELAALAGLTVPAHGETAQAAAARQARTTHRERILAAIALAQTYFARALQADRPEAAAARAYVVARGLEAAVEPWGLGYAPAGTGLQQWLDGHQVAPEVAHDAYLVRRNDDGSRYAFLRARLTLPWCNRQGQPLAHVGRALEADTEPKYLHPGAIDGVFAKAQLVFGLHHAAAGIRASAEAVVVEGQLSAITPHLHGLGNVVACGGKAFSQAHARALRGAGAERLVLLLDGDPAGRQGARAAVEVCLAEGLPCRVAELPAGLDPDDYLRHDQAA